MTRELKTDHVVRTADGAIYVVRYVHAGRASADLWPLDADGVGLNETIELPLSELRRVTDPRKRKPPIEGMPEDRPRCAFCDRPFRPVTHLEFERSHMRGGFGRITRRTFAHWSSYRGLFCTQHCGVDFGAAAHRAGYRIVRTKSKEDS